MIMGGRVDDGCFPSFSFNIRFLMVEQNMALKITLRNLVVIAIMVTTDTKKIYIYIIYLIYILICICIYIYIYK